MKKHLTILSLLAAAVFMAACSKSESKLEAEFSTSLYSLEELGSVDVVLNLSKATDEPLRIPVTFSGSAVKDKDYSVSSEEFVFNAGTKSSSITVTDLGMENKGTITFNIAKSGAYNLGTKYIATVAFDGKEKLIYNFSATKAELVESYTATVTVTGVASGAGFRAPMDLVIPLKLSGDGAEGVVLEANEIKIPKGGNTGSVKMTRKEGFGEDLPADPKAVLEVDLLQAQRFSAGDNGKLNIFVRSSGLLVPARLAGTWKFAEVFDLEEIELWFEEGEDDPSLLPVNNENFTLSFTEDSETGEVTLTPGGTGDFANYFRKAKVTLTNPMNCSAEAVILGDYTASEVNMFEAEALEGGPFVYTYYALSNANRAFSAKTETLGTGVICVRLDEAGDLILQIRDYDTPPFGESWWDGYDADMFSFCSRFTKETE